MFFKPLGATFRALRAVVSAGGGAQVESARPATVRANGNVARGLSLRLPDERELTEQVSATR